jgi:hypothetical protein
MQARFSAPSSLAAHHRRLIASCAESGCPQVRQRSDAKSSARTVGESLCISKSVEAHYKGQIVSARDPPTGCQQQSSLVVPTVRALRHLTEPSAKPPQKQPTKRPERGGRRGQPAPRSAFPARCSDRQTSSHDSVSRRTMQRKPRCEVEVSIACGMRAAGGSAGSSSVQTGAPPVITLRRMLTCGSRKRIGECG